MSNNTDTNSAHNTCTALGPGCTLEETVYGYRPSLGANAFFCAFFGIFLVANLFLTFRFKTWAFGCLIILGCVGEAAGYIGRIMLHSNPFDNTGFELQISTLIFSPVSLSSLEGIEQRRANTSQSFLVAGIYLSLKHIARAVGPQYSPIKPVLYPWIFILCDFTSLLLQAAGGGIAASANTDKEQALGGHIMLAGIIFQVITSSILYVLITLFVLKLQRNKRFLSSGTHDLIQSRSFKIFCLGMLAASFFIYVRCVYRIAELAGGWGNTIMRDEVAYIILDGVLV